MLFGGSVWIIDSSVIEGVHGNHLLSNPQVQQLAWCPRGHKTGSATKLSNYLLNQLKAIRARVENRILIMWG